MITKENIFGRENTGDANLFHAVISPQWEIKKVCVCVCVCVREREREGERERNV